MCSSPVLISVPCLPVFLSQVFFRKPDSLILEFLWVKRTQRLCKQYLQNPNHLEGWLYQILDSTIGLLILEFYWLGYNTFISPPVWIAMESNPVKPVSLMAIVHSSFAPAASVLSKNVIVRLPLPFWFTSILYLCSPGFKPCFPTFPCR